MSKKNEKVELTKEQKAKAEKVKEVVKQQKKAVAKVKEKTVVIEGVSETEAQAIGTLLYYVENTKAQPQAHLNQGLQMKKETEDELAFLYEIKEELNIYNNTGKTLRNVVKRIELYEKNVEKNLNPAINNLEKHIKFVDDTIAKINSHITEKEFEDKVVRTYDKSYFTPMLDIAYVLFEVKGNGKEV